MIVTLTKCSSDVGSIDMYPTVPFMNSNAFEIHKKFIV